MVEKERRVFAGYYKRYDGKHIFVVTTAKDYYSRRFRTSTKPTPFFTTMLKKRMFIPKKTVTNKKPKLNKAVPPHTDTYQF